MLSYGLLYESLVFHANIYMATKIPYVISLVDKCSVAAVEESD